MKPIFLFDLDGTLTDSGKGIIHSVQYSLRKLGVSEPDENMLHAFIGPPLLESFQQICCMDSEQAVVAVAYYREYFRDKGLYENEVYRGIDDLLAELSKKSEIYLATSKPEVFARQILNHFNLAKYFSGIFGASLDGEISEKADVIQLVLDKIGETQRSIYMVGDREHDVLGAKEHGVPCIGVLYGYGDREELLAAGAIKLAETPQELKKLIDHLIVEEA